MNMAHTDSDKTKSVEGLPGVIPIFPLTGVLLLPGGQLPLNIFENQYLAMVEDALKDHRIIGIIQPNGSSEIGPGENRPVFDTGCAGRITSFSETADGRYEIVLTGLSRFSIDEEMDRMRGYRRVRPQWDEFEHDLKGDTSTLKINRERLYKLLDEFFDLHEITCSWESIEAAPDSKLITALSMICPLEPSEKQGLLEARDCARRAEMFMTMLELAIHSGCPTNSSKDQKH